jgi:hypothetical protein
VSNEATKDNYTAYLVPVSTVEEEENDSLIEDENIVMASVVEETKNEGQQASRKKPDSTKKQPKPKRLRYLTPILLGVIIVLLSALIYLFFCYKWDKSGEKVYKDIPQNVIIPIIAPSVEPKANPEANPSEEEITTGGEEEEQAKTIEVENPDKTDQ